MVAILHTIIDLCALPFCFSSQTDYPEVSAFVVVVTFLFMGVYGIQLLRQKERG